MRGDKEGFEEEEGEGESLLRRLIQLLQPNNRDLAANWAVDVSTQLDNYLNHLAVTSLFQDGSGSSSLNFAQAALLIQGSIQIYSRKVEYLYSLVLQTLEFIANKKQVQQEKGSVLADGKDGDIAEEEEEEFLNLDDVEEETNIDIDDEGHEASTLTPATKPPASLLVLEGEAVDITGDGGELAAYQIATSSLHRDFLLLDPCDADAVDKFLNLNKVSSKGTQSQPSSSARRRTPRTPRNGFSTPSKRATSAQKSVKQPDFNDVAYGQGTSDNCDQFVSDTWEVPCKLDLGIDGSNDFNSPHEALDKNIFGGHADLEDEFSEEEEDPWQPLNPHEPGDLHVKPFRRGLLNKRQKVKETNQASLACQFPLARRFGTVCPEFKKVSEAWQHNSPGKQDPQSPPIYEKLRSSFGLNENTPLDAFGVGEDGDEGLGVRDGFEDDAAFDDYVGASNNDFMDMDIPVQLGGESTDGGNLAGDDGATYHENDLDGGGSFEDLCRAHLDALLRNIAESEKQTELASRVSNWKHKIEKNLEEQDVHPPFDIHVYGERLLEKLSSDQEIGVQKSFTEIVSGEEKHEVARTFSALLQLVNNGNVDLDKGMSTGQSFCFTAEKPFYIKLLSSNKKHEEMLKYRAPSMAATSPAVKSSKKSKNKSHLDHQEGIKIREIKDSSNGSTESGRSNKLLTSKRKDAGKQRLESLGTDYNGNYSASTSRKVLGSGSGFTPETKRRRRLLSVRPLEVQAAR